jgi:hypothetical protein
MYLIVEPQLSSGWQHKCSTKIRKGWANEQSIYSPMFMSTGPSGLYYKCFTIVIYDRNDSDQYYKTRITIVIDDLSLS